MVVLKATVIDLGTFLAQFLHQSSGICLTVCYSVDSFIGKSNYGQGMLA